jgi:membrane protein YqaA with SNARE-associated domain
MQRDSPHCKRVLGVVCGLFCGNVDAMLASFFTRLTVATERFARHRHAVLWLFFYAVIESVFFPVPPEVLLIPLALARPERAWRYAGIAAVGSAVGGLVGYGIGRFAFEPVALPLLNWLCAYDARACAEVFLPKLQALFDAHGPWVVGVSAMSPVIPYRFTILAAGLGHMNVLWFAVISVVVHFARYALVTYLVAHYGAQAVHFVRTRLPVMFTMMGAAALVVFLIYAYY